MGARRGHPADDLRQLLDLEGLHGIALQRQPARAIGLLHSRHVAPRRRRDPPAGRSDRTLPGDTAGPEDWNLSALRSTSVAMTRGLALPLAPSRGLAACPAPQGPTLAGYFAPEPGLPSAGVRRIQIHPPRGDFTFWTKRFGSTPRIKLLPRQGGLGAAHECFEALEN